MRKRTEKSDKFRRQSDVWESGKNIECEYESDS